jgi:hypothetical protein
MVSFDLADATAAAFESQLNQTFSLKSGQGELTLKLVEVQPLGPAARPGGAFSLSFLGEPGPFLPQATYRLTHPALGALDVFLVPLGPKNGANVYEAVFA